MSKHLKKIIIIGLVLVACDFLLYVWYGHLVKRRFEGIDPAKADCAVVFFNGFTEEWALNDETIRRCRNALYLFLRHQVSAIVCSGGNRPREGKSGAELMSQWLSGHRYYGHYSNVSRGKRKKHDQDGLIPSILEPVEDPDFSGDGSSKEHRRNWARLIQKIYEIDPLTCTKCQDKMRIIGIGDGAK